MKTTAEMVMEKPDDRSALRQIEELEQKVERLVSAFAAQTEALQELKKKNEDLEEELRCRIESEERYGEERTIIRSKVDNLLGKLERIVDVAQL